jgi:hypothetical protein
MRILIALMAWMTACLPSQALAWGQEGHSVIAEIGQRRLSPKATAAVQSLIGNGSLAAVSTWPDDVRSARPTTTGWHFADVPIDKNDYSPQRDCKPDVARGDCIVAELERLRTELLCGSQEQRQEALMFAVHFVGDIHQPLHTVLEEHGGNDIDVKMTMHGLTCTKDCDLQTNFHRAWDSELIHRTVFSWGTYVDRLETGWLKSAEAKKRGINGGRPADWVVETHQYAQKVWHLLAPDRVLDDNYFNQVLPVIDRQLGVGGLRLARFLNETFASPRCPNQ